MCRLRDFAVRLMNLFRRDRLERELDAGVAWRPRVADVDGTVLARSTCVAR